MSTRGAVTSGLIPSRVKPITLKLVFRASLLDAQHYKGAVLKPSLQVYLLCRWERHIAEFSQRRATDRLPVTSKQARYRALIAFS